MLLIRHTDIIYLFAVFATVTHLMGYSHQVAANDFILDDPLVEQTDTWSALLQELAICPTINSRSAKAMYRPMNNPYRRIGEVASPHSRDNVPPSNFVPYRQAPVNFGNRLVSASEVSETDLYLLSAIEKLVYRVDYLEKRMQKTDKLVLYLLDQIKTNNNNKEQVTTLTSKPPSGAALEVASTTAKPIASDCPNDFQRISKHCYHLETKNPADWQTANIRCKANGARLAEFENASDFADVQKYMITEKPQTANVWLGGLNPGLLWIWSSSAKPINTFTAKNTTESTETTTHQHDNPIKSAQKEQGIEGSGRCLNLWSNGTSTENRFRYHGEDCSKAHSYVCELHDRSVENTISRVLRALRLD